MQQYACLSVQYQYSPGKSFPLQHLHCVSSQLFSLQDAIHAAISREDLVIKLEGLAREDYVKVLLTDTSFYSRGIDRVDTVWDGQITLTKRDLANLRNGPISLEIYREEEKELSETSDGAGRLFVSYGLRRVFELKD